MRFIQVRQITGSNVDDEAGISKFNFKSTDVNAKNPGKKSP
jgi:hypothetical protein